MDIKQLAKFITDTIDPNGMTDNSVNGLQVQNTGTVTKIAVAVDASLATIELAAATGAQALLVHHGLLWGDPLPITDEKYNHYSRIKALIKNNIGLIASHLPLDAHLEYGNNIIMAKMLGLKKIKPFARYHGVPIGFCGQFEKAVSIETVAKLLGINMKDVKYLSFGKSEIKTVGIVSGGGAHDIQTSINEGLDLFITGEGKHSCYHSAREGKINMLMAGHYFTETFGIRALGESVQRELGIECVFIDCPTGF